MCIRDRSITDVPCVLLHASATRDNSNTKRTVIEGDEVAIISVIVLSELKVVRCVNLRQCGCASEFCLVDLEDKIICFI